MIGIIGAMEEEVAEILKFINVKKQKQYYGYSFYEGTMNEKEVVLLQSGIGKVNAAISVSFIIFSLRY